MIVVYKVAEKYKKAARILSNWHFIYEELPSGSLRAEPMDFSVNDKLIMQLGKAGYFSLPCRGGLNIRLKDNQIVETIK